MEKYNEYKDSGVQWLGEIPSHWKMKRLASMFVGEVEINKKYRIKRAFKFNYGDLVPKNEIGDLEEYKNIYTKYPLIKKGDIIINGLNLNYDFVSQRVACTPDEGIITSAYVVCRPRKKVSYNFYTYLFKGMDSMKLFHGMGSGIRLTLSFKELKRQLLPVPPEEEQDAIVFYLDIKCSSIEILLANKKKEITLLQEMKQRVIADAVTRGLNPNVKFMPTNISWLPEIPENWEMVRNKSFMKPTEEKVGKRRDLTLLSLTKQGVIVRDLTEGKGKFPKDFESYLVVKPNNLVFCLFDIDETPRTVGLVHNDGMLTGAYSNFEIDERIVLPEFAYYYYLQVDNIKGLRPYYTGLRKVVRANTFSMLRIPVPPIEEQHAIVSYITERVAKIDSLIEKLNKEIECIKEYKQRLISDVVTGQIKVS